MSLFKIEDVLYIIILKIIKWVKKLAAVAAPRRPPDQGEKSSTATTRSATSTVRRPPKHERPDQRQAPGHVSVGIKLTLQLRVPPLRALYKNPISKS